MRPDDVTEPVDRETAELKRCLSEWAGLAGELLDLLHQQVNGESSTNWRPHFDQIVRAVTHYRDRCRSEIAQIGRWREDELETGEVHEMLWEQGDRLAKWLQRMVGSPQI
ncbi:MAG: hypothetical protein ACJ8KU_02060 [Chthoniobacterales bacterium]